MMRLSQIRDWTAGEMRGEDRTLSAVSTDTRTLGPDSLFVALRGERFDGHAFLAQARDAGAVAALVEEGSDTSVFDADVRVADTRQGLGRLAAGYAAQFPVPRVAVTGNAGKTTVKEMIAILLGEGTLATHGNLNNDIGVPLTLLRLNAEHRQAVIELGANAPGEIAWTSGLVKPDVALITNVTGAHLEGFGSMDGIARAKAEIFTGCAAGATAATRFEPGQDLEALADTLRRAHRKPLNLVVQGTGLPPLAVERGDMLELLGNLLDNACKWAAGEVRLALARDGGLLTVTVDDDGPGIPASRREQVLQRGRRLDERVAGDGLGLAIVSDTVAAYGGQLTLTDSPLGGLRAVLTLPLPD